MNKISEVDHMWLCMVSLTINQMRWQETPFLMLSCWRTTWCFSGYDTEHMIFFNFLWQFWQHFGCKVWDRKAAPPCPKEESTTFTSMNTYQSHWCFYFQSFWKTRLCSIWNRVQKKQSIRVHWTDSFPEGETGTHDPHFCYNCSHHYLSINLWGGFCYKQAFSGETCFQKFHKVLVSIFGWILKFFVPKDVCFKFKAQEAMYFNQYLQAHCSRSIFAEWDHNTFWRRRSLEHLRIWPDLCQPESNWQGDTAWVCFQFVSH